MIKQDFINAQQNQIFNLIDKSLEKEFQKELEKFKNGTNDYKNRIRLFLHDVKIDVITDRIENYIHNRLVGVYKFAEGDIDKICLSNDNYPCILIDLKF